MAIEVPLVPVNLATACLQSFFYGIFFLLSITSIYLLVYRRDLPRNAPRRSGRSRLCRPLVIFSVWMFLSTTIDWMFTVIRLFQAFVHYKDGSAPLEFYSDLTQLTEIVKTGLVLLSLIIGDGVIIYRLWIIWSRNKVVIAFPLCTFGGVIACSTGITYQLTQFKPGDLVFSKIASRWITGICVFTLGTNVYSTGFIAWRLWSVDRVVKKYGGNNLMHALVLIVESAALYTTWALFFFISYESRSNLQYIAVDTWPAISGIALMLINVRVGMGWASKAPHSGQSSTNFSTILFNLRRDQAVDLSTSNLKEGNKSYRAQPPTSSVRITHPVLPDMAHVFQNRSSM